MEYIEEAVRSQVWARVFFLGPTGGGKSRGAFELASRLFGGELKVTYINTERDREKLYADRFKFGLIDLSSEDEFEPELFIDALDLAEERNRGGIIIIDSVTPEWIGHGGCLNLAGRFGDWKTVRPRHDAFVKRILDCNSHVIACCRAKMKYEVTEEEINGRKRQSVVPLGVGPQQDDGLQYEFNLVGRFSIDHGCQLSGHVDPLDGLEVDFANDADRVAKVYSDWLATGTPIEVPVAASDADVQLLVESLKAEGIGDAKIEETFAKVRREKRGVLPPEYVGEQHKKSLERLARKAAAKADADAKAKQGGDGAQAAPAATNGEGGTPDSPAPAEPVAATTEA